MYWINILIIIVLSNFGGEFRMTGFYIHDNRLQAENHRLRELLKKFQSEEYYNN